MSWVDSDGLERGGSCNECGDPVEEPHHAYCESCFAEQQGWRPARAATYEPPDADALAFQRADRERTVMVRMLQRIDEHERRIAQLERERAGAYHLCRGTAA